MTKKDVYPIPRLDDALDRLRGCGYFTTLDIASGYWQYPVAEKDREKTAFATSEGLFEYLVMPFGMCNLGATFQRSMDQILTQYRWQFRIVYIDDVLIYSKSSDEHLTHLELIFERFNASGIVLKPRKCVFASSQINYLGQVISKEGINPDPEKLSAVADFAVPKSVTEIKSFLGLCSYCRRFVKGFANISFVLQEKMYCTFGQNFRIKLFSLSKKL